MTYRILLYTGALAAIVGGMPRVISSFIPYSDGVLELELLYGLIDLSLLVGLVTVYLRLAERLGWLGLVSFLVAMAGLASIVGPDRILWGVDLYRLGAAILLVGLAGLSVAMLWAGVMKSAALYWLAALVTGIMASLSESSFAVAVSGMLFGIGFVSAGVAVIMELDEQQP